MRENLNARLAVEKESFSYRLANIIGTFILVDFAWIFFRAGSISDAVGIVKQMFAEFNMWVLFDGSLYNLGLDNKDFTVGIISIMILLSADAVRRRCFIRGWMDKQSFWFKLLVTYGAIFFILIFGIYGYGYNASEFIYFQF